MTEIASPEWARLRVHLAEHGRRVDVDDLWIAARAVAHRIPIVTQDDDPTPSTASVGSPSSRSEEPP
jgi:predicted nucleic acid-binding protein